MIENSREKLADQLTATRLFNGLYITMMSNVNELTPNSELTPTRCAIIAHSAISSLITESFMPNSFGEVGLYWMEQSRVLNTLFIDLIQGFNKKEIALALQAINLQDLSKETERIIKKYN